MDALTASVWFKLAGGVLAVACSGLAGVEQARLQRRAADELGRWITALAALETEVDYGQSRLPQALERAADAAGGVAGKCLFEAAQMLRDGSGSPGQCIRCATASHPCAGQLQPVVVLGDVLGSSHGADQIRHIRLAMTRLERARATAEDRAARYSKLWPAVGFLTGAMIAVALA